jgi:hypothetical protein
MKKMSPTATMWTTFFAGLLIIAVLAFLRIDSKQTLKNMYTTHSTLLQHQRSICSYAAQTYLVPYDDDAPSTALISKLSSFPLTCVSPVSRHNATEMLEMLKTQQSSKWVRTLITINRLASDYLSRLTLEMGQP